MVWYNKKKYLVFALVPYTELQNSWNFLCWEHLLLCITSHFQPLLEFMLTRWAMGDPWVVSRVGLDVPGRPHKWLEHLEPSEPPTASQGRLKVEQPTILTTHTYIRKPQKPGKPWHEGPGESFLTDEHLDVPGGVAPQLHGGSGSCKQTLQVSVPLFIWLFICPL